MRAPHSPALKWGPGLAASQRTRPGWNGETPGRLANGLYLSVMLWSPEFHWLVPSAAGACVEKPVEFPMASVTALASARPSTFRFKVIGGGWTTTGSAGLVLTGLWYVPAGSMPSLCNTSEWGVTLHGLRHSHASHMLASNVHPKIVQERLGHSSIAITLDIYSHLMPNMQEGAAAAVDGVLRAAIKKHTDDVG